MTNHPGRKPGSAQQRMTPDQLRDLIARAGITQARAGYLAELATKAAQAAAMAADDVRQAQRVACDMPGEAALELLLREAITDAMRLADRLALIASFAATVRRR